MTKQEINKRIEEIENRRFSLDMKDMWSTADYLEDAKLQKEWLELKFNTKAIDEKKEG